MKRLKTFILILLVAVVATAAMPFGATAAESTVAAAECGFSYGEHMNGKSVVFYGDSITARYINEQTYEDNLGAHYTQILAAEYGFYFANYAISGATFTNTDKSVIKEINNSKSILACADYVSIMLGTNDYGFGQALGTKSSAPSETTVYGAIKYALDTIFDINPNVKVMLITPIDRFDGGYGMQKPNARGYTLADVVTAIKTVADMYGVSVADTTGLITETNYNSLLQRDKLHVSSAGYAALAQKIKQA